MRVPDDPSTPKCFALRPGIAMSDLDMSYFEDPAALLRHAGDAERVAFLFRRYAPADQLGLSPASLGTGAYV